MPNAGSLLTLAVVSLLLGGHTLVPVLRDNQVDGRKKLTLLSHFIDKVVSPGMGGKAFKLALAALPAYYSRHANPTEKAWLVGQGMVGAHTPNTQVVLVSVANLLTVLVGGCGWACCARVHLLLPQAPAPPPLPDAGGQGL